MARLYPHLTLLILACGPKKSTPEHASASAQEATPVAPFHPLNHVSAMSCDAGVCTLSTVDGLVRFVLADETIEATAEPPSAPPEIWPVETENLNLNEAWNASIANRWRSPFQAAVPAPGGGFLRAQRGAMPGTSRVVRLGGSVITARTSLDPGQPGYPNTLALHPTGGEAYHIVWPNPDLIAFDAHSLKTTWRIQLDGPAVGLFVSPDGRYLVAELDGEAPDFQLLDYEPARRIPPAGVDPTADPALLWLNRPPAKRTVFIDLKLGDVVATLPGPMVSFVRIDGSTTVVASSGAVAMLQSSSP
jgi:hypothetical protein